jgi:hypothetical protein
LLVQAHCHSLIAKFLPAPPRIPFRGQRVCSRRTPVGFYAAWSV